MQIITFELVSSRLARFFEPFVQQRPFAIDILAYVSKQTVLGRELVLQLEQARAELVDRFFARLHIVDPLEVRQPFFPFFEFL